jgi:putative copper resistance protein D
VDLNGWDLAGAATRALAYMATLSAGGATYFLNYAGTLLTDPQSRRVRGAIGVSCLIAVVASVAQLASSVASMGESVSALWDPALTGMVLYSHAGTALALRLVGLGVLGIALKMGPAVRGAALSSATLAVISFAAVGHVHALPALWPTLLLALHLICAAFWLGALWPLRRVALDGALAQTAALAERFGFLALTAVPLLLLAGVAMASQLLEAVSDLWRTQYGALLAAKIGVVALLLSIAAFNKLKLTPALKRGEMPALRSLRRSISLEMGFGFLILIVTATFTTFTGPGG